MGGARASAAGGEGGAKKDVLTRWNVGNVVCVDCMQFGVLRPGLQVHEVPFGCGGGEECLWREWEPRIVKMAVAVE